MPTTLHVIFGAAVATLVWTCIGAAIARRLRLGPALIWPAAPALGWAVHSAAVLPILRLVGFSPASVLALALLALAMALATLWTRSAPDSIEPAVRLPTWVYLGAALVALAPATAIMPKLTAAGVVLDGAIYDHSKVAIIDEIARLGLPPGNPFFAEAGEPARLVYYYLWHFAAAELSPLPGLGGWGADIALTWFSAFASLMAMAGLATWFTGRRAAAGWVLLLCVSGSMRPVLAALLGPDRVAELILEPTGFAGWLFQAAWVPQHIASATCVVLATFLLSRMVERPSALLVVTIVLLVAAGFESSTWVGGVTFAIAAAAIGPVLLIGAEAHQRLRLVLGAGAAAFLALALVAPFIRDQLVAAAAHGGSPIAIDHYPVLATAFPDSARRILDWPAYWVVLLLIEFPAIYPAGAVALTRLIVSRELKPEARRAARVLGLLTLASLAAAWLLVSKLADNNDLAWRAVLPGLMVLTVFAAAGLTRWIAARAWLPVAAALACVLVGLPYGVWLVHQYTAAPPGAADEEFAGTVPLWDAVRRHTAPSERVANNPLFLGGATPWPINISWALLADRRSCYPGAEWTKVFTTLPAPRRAAIDAQFARVFAGNASPQDLHDLAARYRCRVVVLTPDDGAWTHDPFATSPDFRLVEANADRWRIYRTTGGID